jgi:hypothetical protein
MISSYREQNPLNFKQSIDLPKAQHNLDVFEFQGCLSGPSEQTSRLEHILDLATIELGLG